MNCINSECNHRATPVVKFGIVVSYICEHCGRKFGVSDQGQATQKEIEELQCEQMTQIVNTGTYKPPKFNVGGNANIKMYDPVKQREKGFGRYRECRIRG